MKVKQKVFLALAVLAFAGCANTQNALPNGTCGVSTAQKCEMKNELTGVYKTTLPCADCDGIRATLILKDDKSFSYIMTYENQQKYTDNQSGVYSVAGDILTTENLYKEKQMYKIVNGALKMLDSQGDEVSGELAEFYTFKKIR